MECTIEFKNSQNKLMFACQKSKQKIILDVLLQHSGMKLVNLATIIGVSTNTLSDVYTGTAFLNGKAAINLIYVLFIFLCE